MRTRFWNCALDWLAIISIPGDSTPGQTNSSKVTSVWVSPEQFIAAFELTPEANFRFTWPPDSMRPAEYETVWLVVEKMPYAWDASNQEGRSSQLRVGNHLLVNDRPVRTLADRARQPRVESASSAQRFLVKLDQGRLRIRLVIPAQLRLDPSHNKAKIRIYSHADNNWGLHPK